MIILNNSGFTMCLVTQLLGEASVYVEIFTMRWCQHGISHRHVSVVCLSAVCRMPVLYQNG